MASLGLLPTTSKNTNTQPTTTPSVSQSDIDFVLPFMNDFVAITSKSILDGFNAKVVREFQLDQIEVMV